MQEDNQDLNERNLQEFQDEVSNYLTDSDIEDPKYLPTLSKHTNEHPPLQDHLLYPLQDKIKTLAYDSDFKNKQFRELENENNLLKTEIFKLQESLNAKDVVIEEFEHMLALTKTKFSQFEEKNKSLQMDNKSLMSQIDQYERDLRNSKSQLEASSSNSKSCKVYEEHIAELQADYTQRETKLNRRYQDKEAALKTEYLNELAKISRELDEVKVDKEKHKYEVSTYKIKYDDLKTQIEERETELNADIAKKTKDNKKLTEQLKEMAEKISQMELDGKMRATASENALQSLKDAKASLMEEAATKEERIVRLEESLGNAKHSIEMMTIELKELNRNCENKDIIIDQMRNQNEAMYKELSLRENELIQQDQLKQKDIADYTRQYNAVVSEKNDIESQNAELIENLSKANVQLKKMSDIMTDKYSTLEMDLYKQSSKNENLEKTYKGMIKQLKHKEKSLFQENKSLKEQINQKDYEKEQMAYQYQNDIQNLSFYNSQNYGSMNNNYNTSSPLVYEQTNMNNSMSMYDAKEEGQKKTLEEFKRLLSKIDEKLDLPMKNI